MRRGLSVTILLVSLCILLSACGSKTPVIISHTVSDIETIANVRYTGYTDEVKDALDRSFENETVREDIESSIKTDSLIDITDVVLNATHEDLSKQLDPSILRKEDKYYIDTTQVKFNYPDLTEVKLQIYDDEYILKKNDIPTNMEQLKGNKNYKLQVESYDLYDDNVLIVELSSSMKDNVMANKQVIEVEVNENGKVEQANASEFTSILMYD